MTTFLGIIVFVILLAICVWGLRESMQAADKFDRQRSYAPAGGGSYGGNPNPGPANTSKPAETSSSSKPAEASGSNPSASSVQAQPAGEQKADGETKST